MMQERWEYNSPDIFDTIRSLHFEHLTASFVPYTLQFITPARTSRGVINERTIWILKVHETDHPDIFGLGECAPLPGLSQETAGMVERNLKEVCTKINDYQVLLTDEDICYASVRFAVEQALIDLSRGGRRILFPSKFTNGHEQITINGLIWMGSIQYMINQINEKVQQGFSCIKMKISNKGFENELALLQEIRNTFGFDDIELRLDANGAFDTSDVWEKLDLLAPIQIHSIEQPIAINQWEEMAEICRSSPIPIALDEELIGITDRDEKANLLDNIFPSYIILKPSLLGGFQQTSDWIELAEERSIGWWITSALESNIGLNAIAQWTFTLQNPMPQGLGTGKLFVNNFLSPLTVKKDMLIYDPAASWQINLSNV